MLQNANSKTALLILDVQNDFTGEQAKMPAGVQQVRSIIENLNKMIEYAKKTGLTVIYIGNEYSKFDIFNIFRNFASLKGTIGARLDSRLHIVNGNYFSKNKMNAFSNPKLNEFLKCHAITNLFISGLFAENCIYETTKGAIIHNYSTVVLTDCIAYKRESNKTKMIEKYIKKGAKALAGVPFVG